MTDSRTLIVGPVTLECRSTIGGKAIPANSMTGGKLILEHSSTTSLGRRLMIADRPSIARHSATMREDMHLWITVGQRVLHNDMATMTDDLPSLVHKTLTEDLPSLGNTIHDNPTMIGDPPITVHPLMMTDAQGRTGYWLMQAAQLTSDPQPWTSALLIPDPHLMTEGHFLTTDGCSHHRSTPHARLAIGTLHSTSYPLSECVMTVSNQACNDHPQWHRLQLPICAHPNGCHRHKCRTWTRSTHRPDFLPPSRARKPPNLC